MCGEELEQLDDAASRVKTCFTIIGFLQILVYISTWSTMLLGGHCQPDEATIPYALSIMMFLQFLVYLIILLEHFLRSYSVD